MFARLSKLLITFGVVLALPILLSACGASDFPTIAVTVSPLCVVLTPGGNQSFQANIFVNGVDQGVDNSAVTWSVLGGDVNGVVDSNGSYLAPNTNPPPASQVQVIATSIDDDQKQGQATVILSATPTPIPNPCDAPPFS